jgi:hypothetical protein
MLGHTQRGLTFVSFGAKRENVSFYKCCYHQATSRSTSKVGCLNNVVRSTAYILQCCYKLNRTKEENGRKKEGDKGSKVDKEKQGGM